MENWRYEKSSQNSYFKKAKIAKSTHLTAGAKKGWVRGEAYVNWYSDVAFSHDSQGRTQLHTSTSHQ